MLPQEYNSKYSVLVIRKKIICHSKRYREKRNWENKIKTRMVVAVTSPRHAHMRAHLQYATTTDREVNKLRKLTTQGTQAYGLK